MNTLMRDILKDIEEIVKETYPDGWGGKYGYHMYSVLDNIHNIGKSVVSVHGVCADGFIAHMYDTKIRQVIIPFRLSDGSYVNGLVLKASFKNKNKGIVFSHFNLSDSYIEEKLDITLEEYVAELEELHTRQLEAVKKRENDKKVAFRNFLSKYQISSDDVLPMLYDLAKLGLTKRVYCEEGIISKLSHDDDSV